jgi:hypothetical protein
MKLEGGCYCGAMRYLAEGEPRMKAQCHCRECSPQMAIYTIDKQAFHTIAEGVPSFERLPQR